VVVDSVRIALRDGGEGRPVVLIHGTPSHSYIWREVIPELENAGHRVLAFDLLGYGLSERPLDRDTSVAAQAQILEGLLERLGVERAHLVGHDIGGAVAMIFATRNLEQVPTLTLIDTVSYDSWPSQSWQRIIADHLHNYHRMSLQEFYEMMAGQLSMTVFDKSRMSEEVLEAYLEPLMGELGKTSFFAHQVAHYDCRYTEEITEELKKLPMPVKILWGEADEWQPLYYGERLAGDIPGGRAHRYPGGRSFPDGGCP